MSSAAKLVTKARNQFRRGDFDASSTTAARALKADPRDVEALNVRACALIELGKAPDACRDLEKAILLDADNPGLIRNLATAQRKAGRPEAAKQSLMSLVKQGPVDLEILLELAETFNELGEYPQAQKLLGQAMKLAKAEPRIGMLLSQTHAGAGDFETALKLAEAAMRLAGESPQSAENAASIAYKAQRWKLAEELYARVIEADPGNVTAMASYATTLTKQGFHRRAVAALEAFNADRQDPDISIRLAESCFYAGYADRAVKHAEKAIARQGETVAALCYLGRAYLGLGRLDDAIDVLKRAIALEPGNLLAYDYLAEAGRGELDDQHVELLEGAKSHKDITEEGLARVGFTLGRVYERRGEFDRAFENFAAANRTLEDHRARFGKAYDAKQTVDGFEALKRDFSRDYFEAVAGHGSESKTPVFVIGMPRSGTTLVHQMLAAHSEVEGAGELNEMHQLTGELTRLRAKGESAAFRDAVCADARDIAERYLAVLQEGREGARRVVDKMPPNFKHLGLIHAVFPKARVIHIRRNPVDTCLSIFVNHFSEHYRYSTNLGNIGHYYLQYLALMEHWRRNAPFEFLEIDYEALVAEPEPHGRRMVEFIGVDWEEGCLDLSRAKSAVATFSASQVRGSINRRSVEKWRRYEGHLAPLLEALGDAAPA